MTFRVGEKVKFLNTKGEGIIKRVIDSRMVLVTIEGGFDIPVLANELIADRGDMNNPAAKQPEPATEIPVMQEEEERLPLEVIKSRKSEDVYLAFMPHDQKWLIAGPLDIFLINNTNGDILYSIFRKEPGGGFSGVDYGSVPAASKAAIATIEREELPQWIEGNIQFLFHVEKCDEVPLPFNADYSVQGKKFYQETNYKLSALTGGKSIVIRIATMVTAKPAETQVLPVEPVVKTTPSDDFIFRHKTRDREAEVDLHITEIIDDPAKLEKHEILNYQKNYFLRCLESAIVNHFRKVIFIHGVGNGVLREVILDHLLKQKGIEVFDAPMSKYGVGAVEVRILISRDKY